MKDGASGVKINWSSNCLCDYLREIAKQSNDDNGKMWDDLWLFFLISFFLLFMLFRRKDQRERKKGLYGRNGCMCAGSKRCLRWARERIEKDMAFQ